MNMEQENWIMGRYWLMFFVCEGLMFVLVGTTFGQTWTDCGAPGVLEPIACSADGTKVIAAPDLSTNSGGNWSSSSLPYSDSEWRLRRLFG